MKPYYQHAGITIYHGNNLEACPHIAGISAVATDPPYGFSFMGKEWDKGVPGIPFWTAISACCLPGCHIVAFGGPRTAHRLVCAIEDAGWEIRDSLAWIFGQGFPKSHDISKAIDRENNQERKVAEAKTGPRPGNHGGSGSYGHGTDRSITTPASETSAKWSGWGTALKPAIEPICLARKPISEATVAANVLKHGTGALNIDAGRIGTEQRTYKGSGAQPSKLDNHSKGDTGIGLMDGSGSSLEFSATGRFPANVLLDEVAAQMLDEQSGELTSGKLEPHHKRNREKQQNTYGEWADGPGSNFANESSFGDSGGASRFFYTAKASGTDRGNHVKSALPLFGEDETEFRNTHPTVKPLSLMRYLVRLIAPPGGVVLDPFMGSGTTLVACKQLGFQAIGIELEEKYCEIAARRLEQNRENYK